MRVVTAAAASLAMLAASASGATAGTTELVSLDYGVGFVTGPLAVSADGRLVMFSVSFCHFGCTFDGYIRDRRDRTTTFVCGDAQQDGPVAMSRDGRFLLCQTAGSEDGAAFRAHLVDRQTGTDVFITGHDPFGPGDTSSGDALSPDGRYAAIHSSATDLVPGDTNGFDDVFLYDARPRTFSRVSLGPHGRQANSSSTGVAVTPGGRFVTFDSPATDLIAGGTGGREEVYLRDRQAGTTERISVGLGGADPDGDSSAGFVSDDGLTVVFNSVATNLVAGDRNGRRDVFVRDRQAGTTTRISRGHKGAEANGDSAVTSLSRDGNLVVFESAANNLVAGDGNGVLDVFLYDRRTRTTERVSVSSKGVGGDKASSGGAISADGRVVAFYSEADNLVPHDANGKGDIFVRVRQ